MPAGGVIFLLAWQNSHHFHNVFTGTGSRISYDIKQTHCFLLDITTPLMIVTSFAEIASAAFFLPVDKYWESFLFLSVLISIAILLFRKTTLQSKNNSTWCFENEMHRDVLFRKLLENTNHGLAEIEHGVIVNVDQCFASLFEFKPVDLLGSPISRIISCERAQDDQSPIFETVGKTAKGETLYLEVLQSFVSVTNTPRQIIAVRDITERRKAEEELKQLALYDSTTKLYNRAFLLRHITSRQISTEKHLQTSLFFIDLDNFKTINDRYGHEKGDEILRAVGERLVKTLRDDDIVARYGGDEFVIACNSLSDNSYTIAQRILAAMQSPFLLNESSIYLTASIGIVHNILDYPDIEAALRTADKAMYHAKKIGKNQFIFAPQRDQKPRKQKNVLPDQTHISLSFGCKPERRKSL